MSREGVLKSFFPVCLPFPVPPLQARAGVQSSQQGSHWVTHTVIQAQGGHPPLCCSGLPSVSRVYCMEYIEIVSITFFPGTHRHLNLLKRYSVSLSLPPGLGVPPAQLSKYGNLGHVNLAAVQEPLAFLLPKRELVLCLEDKELVPAPPAESGLGPEATAAGCGHPDGAQEPAGSAEAPDGDTSPAPQPPAASAGR